MCSLFITGQVNEWRKGSISDTDVCFETAENPRLTDKGHLRRALFRSQSGNQYYLHLHYL